MDSPLMDMKEENCGNNPENKKVKEGEGKVLNTCKFCNGTKFIMNWKTRKVTECKCNCHEQSINNSK